MIPDGWKRKSLGEIADISSGSTPLRQKDEYWNKGNIPWVTTGEINYQIIESTKEKITELASKECSLKIHTQGTILMAMYGQGVTRGRIALLGINAATNQACCAISVDSSADTKFIYFQLEYLYQEIRKLGHGGNQQNLNGQIIKQIPIMFPPLLEQSKIAEILGAWDESIDLLEKLIDKTRSRKLGLMQQLLTGKKRFKEFEGSEWKEFQLAQIANITMGTSPKSESYNSDKEGLPLLQGNADIKNRVSLPRIWTSEVTKECYPNDILISVRAPVGTIAISLHHACIGRGIASIKAKSKVIPNYLYQLLLFFEPKWETLSQGSTFDSVNSADIKNRIFSIPLMIPEQEKIAAVLSAADDEISTLEKQLAAYKQQKRGLMQQLLTGRIRI